MNNNETKMKIRIAAYIRVSGDESALKGYSPFGQKEAIKGYINNHQDYKNAEVTYFQDDAISGKIVIDGRPDLKKIFEMARKRELDLVLVWRLDRFFRNTRRTLEAVEELMSFGVEFGSVTESFDTSTPSGRLVLAMLASISEYEWESIRMRTEMGKIRAAKDGVWLGGGVPFGYKLNSDSKHLEINEDEAKIVRLMFKLLVEQGESAYYVQKFLNDNEIPTRYDRLGKEKKSKTHNWWRKRTVTRILTNPVYTGVFVYKRKKIAQRSEYEANMSSPEETVLQSVPQIVNPIVFDKAQLILKRNKEKAKRNTKKDYLFNQLIRCGECNQTFFARTRTLKQKDGNSHDLKYYGCVTKMSQCNPYTCTQKQLREERLEQAIWPRVALLLSDPELVYTEIENRLKQVINKPDLEKKLEQVKLSLRKSTQSMERLKKLYVEGSYSDDVFRRMQSEIKSEISKAEYQITTLTGQLAKLPRLADLKASLTHVYGEYKSKLDNLTYQEKSLLLHKLISGIVYESGKALVGVELPLKQLQAQPRMG